MQVSLEKSFSFEAAHYLPKVSPTHKCSRLHGHSYKVTVKLQGDLNQEMGWLVDFADVKEAFDHIRKDLDHHTLNEVPGLENPTAEIIAIYIFNRLKSSLKALFSVVVRETESSACEYHGS